MRCSHTMDSAFFMLPFETCNLSFSWGCRWQRWHEQRKESKRLYKKIYFFFVLALNFATFVLSLCLVGVFVAHEEKALSPQTKGNMMKKTFANCVNRITVGALTLLGFAATMTLAACYGPMPEKYYADEEIADSLAGEVDSVSVDTEL